MGCGGRSMYAEERGHFQDGSLAADNRRTFGKSSIDDVSACAASKVPPVAKPKKSRRSPTPPPDQHDSHAKAASVDYVRKTEKYSDVGGHHTNRGIGSTTAIPTIRVRHRSVRNSCDRMATERPATRKLRPQSRQDLDLTHGASASLSTELSPQMLQVPSTASTNVDCRSDSAEDSQPLDFEKRDSLRRVVQQLVEPSQAHAPTLRSSARISQSNKVASGARRKKSSQSHSLGPGISHATSKPRVRASRKSLVIDDHSSFSADPKENSSRIALGSTEKHLENSEGALLPRPRPAKSGEKIDVGPRRSRSQPSLVPKSRLSSPSHKQSRTNGLDEATILTRGSELQGMVIGIWDMNDPDVKGTLGWSATMSIGESFKFEDADGLPGLSAHQGKSLHAWQRFSEVSRAGQGANMGKPIVLAAAPSSENIKQGFVGDCSFLSALSVLSEYERKFDKPILSSLIHPRDFQDRPTFSHVGKYCCRMFLNGAMRKIVIDDRVPVRRNGELLCAHSANSCEMWVTLLEKSYAKIMGGSFDIQGSNPGIDVFHLTGWLPETVFLSNLDASTGCGGTAMLPDDLFARASRGYNEGSCVLCVGTSAFPDAKQDKAARQLGHVEGVSASTGLVAHHAYPVLECRCIGQHRLLHLKNPWGRISWRGCYAPGDVTAWEKVSKELNGSSLVNAFGYDPSSVDNDDGHFWIGWNDILRFFSHLYICWSPSALGLYCMEAHGRWDPEPHFTTSSLHDDTYLVAFNPQYLLHLEEPLPEHTANDLAEGIWVLLSRHFKLRSDLSSRYVTTHIFDGTARLCCPDAPRKTGVYSNGECAFVRLGEIGQGRQDFVLVVSQYDSKVPFNFTLQVYSAVRGILTPLPPLIPKGFISNFVQGEWTAETAGGCSNDRWSYFQNPHWRLNVTSGGLSLFMFIECCSELCVNVRLFSGTVADPDKLRSAESSGAYRQGCCMLKMNSLSAGPYVAVVSAFKSGVCGQYRIIWHASKAIEIYPQPHPFAVPLQAPLECLARRVKPGVRAQFRLSNKPAVVDAPVRRSTLLSVRLQCDFNQGLPPLLKLLREDSGECLTDTLAESYFAFSGASVVLLAELLLNETCMLDAFVPNGGQGGVALYINSDGPISLVDTISECTMNL